MKALGWKDRGHCAEYFIFQISIKDNFSCSIDRCSEFLQVPVGVDRLVSGAIEHFMIHHWIFALSKPEAKEILVGDSSKDKNISNSIMNKQKNQQN